MTSPFDMPGKFGEFTTVYQNYKLCLSWEADRNFHFLCPRPRTSLSVSLGEADEERHFEITTYSFEAF